MRARTASMPKIEPPRKNAVVRDLPRPSGERELEALWKRFLADQGVQKALRRVILKALHGLVLHDSADRESLFNRLHPGKKWRRKLWRDGEKDPRPDPVSDRCRVLKDLLHNFIPTDLRYELLATVWAPNPTRAEQRKILARVAKAKREKLPGWKEPARALLASAGAPTARKEMADRRRLGRWAKRWTGTDCDAEVATFITAARRVASYQKPRVSERSLTTDRHRHPAPRRRTRKVTPAELNKLFD